MTNQQPGRSGRISKRWFDDWEYIQFPKTYNTYIGDGKAPNVRNVNALVLSLPNSFAKKLILVDDEDPAVRELWNVTISALDALSRLQGTNLSAADPESNAKA